MMKIVKWKIKKTIWMTQGGEFFHHMPHMIRWDDTSHTESSNENFLLHRKKNVFWEFSAYVQSLDGFHTFLHVIISNLWNILVIYKHLGINLLSFSALNGLFLLFLVNISLVCEYFTKDMVSLSIVFNWNLWTVAKICN